MAADIGPLDRRLRIEQRSGTRDTDYGTPLASSWQTVRTVWASVQDVLPSRGESLAQGLNIAERPARVRMPYMTGITSEMRAVDLTRSNRVLKILTQPVEIGEKDGIEFMVADFTTSGNAE
jgi:head-tail adaptor